MRYRGLADFAHDQPERTGLLLVNLGTPDAPEPREVRRYLAEFLADPRVVELPRALWLPLLHGVILPLRARRSAHAYARIWDRRGSPLRWQSEALAQAVQECLDEAGQQVEVRLAMRYGRPAIGEVLDRWIGEGLRRLLVLPLYPQFSATTTASVFDAVTACLQRWRWPPELRWINDYFAEPGWVEAIAARIRAHWQTSGRGEVLLLSFHGIPKRYQLAGDPYYCQCLLSARRIAAALGLEDGAWRLAFQSRVGREAWLEPYTDRTLEALAREGVRTVDVVCPGFAVDCLETLEEIALAGAEAFRAAGGERLHYIPALNDSPQHAELLAQLARRHLAGWPATPAVETR
ncbi:MAG: ferrochelatase [Lysobacteraceae bacterium]|nr:MAG: ferrochelatase [Xanthomonadaceae bacterium]